MALVRSTPVRLLAIGCLGALAGCYYPGGPGGSADRFTYESTSWQPWSVTLMDSRTNTPIWSVDVPVGKELVVGFKEDQGIKDTATPDLMKWDIFPIGTRFGDLKNSMPVPPSWGRRLDTKLRPTPELPEDMTTQPAPSKPPVIVQP